MPDWPGILFDFCIEPQGMILQTQPLEEVADTPQPYVAQAINVAFLGDFDDELPTNEQLYAGGQLIAWLLRRYPHLSIDDIKGLSEVTDHESPGDSGCRAWGGAMNCWPTCDGPAVWSTPARPNRRCARNGRIDAPSASCRSRTIRLCRSNVAVCTRRIRRYKRRSLPRTDDSPHRRAPACAA